MQSYYIPITVFFLKAFHCFASSSFLIFVIYLC